MNVIKIAYTENQANLYKTAIKPYDLCNCNN